MGAILDRSTVTVEMCLRHSRLNLTNEDIDDPVFEIMLNGVKELADHVCENNFVLEDANGEPILDDDGNEQEVAIPSLVELWIMRKFAHWTENRLSGANKITLSDIGSITPDKRDWAELQPYRKYWLTGEQSSPVSGYY